MQAGPDTAGAVLAAVRVARGDVDAAQVRVLRGVLGWAELHRVSAGDAGGGQSAAGGVVELFGDRPVAVAGPGAPLVAEFAIVELAAKRVWWRAL